VTATHQDELAEFIRASADGYFVLAGGSNVIVADAGVDATGAAEVRRGVPAR
jgi:UDP-N-acetylenolpyruvoylglucosamine reductase